MRILILTRMRSQCLQRLPDRSLFIRHLMHGVTRSIMIRYMLLLACATLPRRDPVPRARLRVMVGLDCQRQERVVASIPLAPPKRLLRPDQGVSRVATRRVTRGTALVVRTLLDLLVSVPVPGRLVATIVMTKPVANQLRLGGPAADQLPPIAENAA